MSLMIQGYSFDFSYTINHLSFGRDEDFKLIQRRFKDQGIMNTLDGVSVQAKPVSETQITKTNHLQTNFYLTAVPSFFITSGGSKYQVYQLTQNYISDYNAQQSILMFNYELSPITVKYEQVTENFLDFLLYICAIIGGVFTVAGIIDAMIHKSVSAIFKQRIGKLN